MSWFGGGLSNLQGKISSFTAQVLNEVAESVQGDDEEDKETSEQLVSASTTEEILQVRQQNEVLVLQNRELESQLSTLSRQYRNLLSSSKSETSSGAKADHPTVVVSESSWQQDVQQWLKSQGLELPQSLKDRVTGTNGTESGDDQTSDQKCQILKEKVAALEEQLVDLDQQHQAALDVAISSRDQLKEDNRQLQLQLMQLLNDRQTAKSGPLFPIDEESEEVNGESPVEKTEYDIKKLEGDQQFFRDQIGQFQNQFHTLNHKLAKFEDIQAENEKLKQEIASLKETAFELETNRLTTESRINKENADLKAKLESLQNQNQILSSMTSVLDKVTNENRLLETSLESANLLVQTKSDQIDQLQSKLAEWQSKTVHIPTVKIESSTETDTNWSDIQQQIDDGNSLRTQLENLKVEECEKRSLEMNRANELANENRILKEQIDEIRNSCSIKLEEAETSRSKFESDLAQACDDLLLSKSEMERVQEEKRLLVSNIESLNQTLADYNQQIEQLTTERSSLTEKLLNAEQASESSRIEASTEQNSQFLVDENLQLRSKLEMLESQYTSTEQNSQLLLDENLQLKGKLEELESQYTNQMAALKNELAELNRQFLEQSESEQRFQTQIQESENQCQALQLASNQLQEELEATRKRNDELSDSFTCQEETLSRLQSELEESRLTLAETRDLCQKENIRNQELYAQKISETDKLHQELEALRALEQEMKSSSTDSEERLQSLSHDVAARQEEITVLKQQLETVQQERDQINSSFCEAVTEKELLRETLQAFQQQREQLVQTVQQKHQEAVSYHNETLRLAKICEELQAKLNEQVEVELEASRLRSEFEQLKASHNQKQAELERLRSHLLSVEETYTQELLKSQAKEKVLKETLQQAEERAAEQWRMGDQLNVWQERYRQCLADKERLEKEKTNQDKSMDRLQHALQQLTRERERDIVMAQKELAQKLAQAESQQNEKDSEMAMLRKKLSEAQLGLEAAGRLTQQLDKTTAALAASKDEVRSKEAELVDIRQQIEELRGGSDSKVDRSLMKNLLIGYFSAPSPKHRLEILRIIATVMDFSVDERKKSGVEESSSGLSGWATGLLKMTARSRTSSGNSSAGDAEKSFSEAFINFLETETVRPSPPKLPAQKVEVSPSSTRPNSSMTNFQPGRNEPTILRDVLRDTET